MMTLKLNWLAVAVATLVWIVWCFLVVTTIVPAVLRKLTIYPGMTAWVLCIIPAILGAIVLLSLNGEDQS